jgi:hypothetical protein
MDISRWTGPIDKSIGGSSGPFRIQILAYTNGTKTTQPAERTVRREYTQGSVDVMAGWSFRRCSHSASKRTTPKGDGQYTFRCYPLPLIIKPSLEGKVRCPSVRWNIRIGSPDRSNRLGGNPRPLGCGAEGGGDGRIRAIYVQELPLTVIIIPRSFLDSGGTLYSQGHISSGLYQASRSQT